MNCTGTHGLTVRWMGSGLIPKNTKKVLIPGLAETLGSKTYKFDVCLECIAASTRQLLRTGREEETVHGPPIQFPPRHCSTCQRDERKEITIITLKNYIRMIWKYCKGSWGSYRGLASLHRDTQLQFVTLMYFYFRGPHHPALLLNANEISFE